MIKEVTVIKKYFDTDTVHIGNKIHVKRVLSCELYHDGTKGKIIYDMDNVGIITDIDEHNEDNCEWISVEINNDYIDIYIDDVVNGEYELEIVK